MRESVIIYGLGKEFEKHKLYLHSKYEIVGYSDANYDKESIFDKYIRPEKIKLYEYDLVLITSRDAALSIMIDCIEKYNVPVDKISVFDGVLFDGFNISGNIVKGFLDSGMKRSSLEYFYERFLVAYNRLDGIIPASVRGGTL